MRPEKRDAVTVVHVFEQAADVAEWGAALSTNQHCDQFVPP